ncbi:toxin HipA [Reichenbachiella sp. 5M10]|uniref:type II toxin-antitoxin system HipA family toxin n=1 Tax=Reichenbachiella sp. 5M10 TaxID=1889772 RepID=UPI000C14CF6B|nr:type II toxin-antitoxin system HipA family toxin [Reichenbachiella sp. 5M10]PIB34983.1 toxin HipA [Reichenbachiella sp. 5M10]
MVEIAEVKIWNEVVGAVQWIPDRQIALFEYDAKFIAKGWDLSPLLLPIANGARTYSFPELSGKTKEEKTTFKGLPGMLADALPDRYGNQLINLWLAQRGRPIDSMNPVEQLCFIGTRGMGALEFSPAHDIQSKSVDNLEISGLIEVAKKMLSAKDEFLTNLSKDEEQAMKDILKIGTSAGGARPKAVIAYDEKTGAVKSGQSKVPKGYEHWLLKLDGVSDAQFGAGQGWGRVEYAYYLMAQACGIEMSDCKLLEEGGRAHFMTKRFDRTGNEKHHVQTFCGIQHFDYKNLYSYSYEQLFQTMRALRLSYPEAEQMFRRMVFNVLATNCDDHTKNFSFRLKKDEKWTLSPAYDVCYSFDPTNSWVSQQTLSVNGKHTGITKKDFMTIAEANNIKKAEKTIDEIGRIIKNWQDFATEAKVNDERFNQIKTNLHDLVN